VAAGANPCFHGNKQPTVCGSRLKKQLKPDSMNILLLGSGGREHALAWKISQSNLLSRLYIAPGNAGTSQIGINLAISPLDFQSIRKAVLEFSIEMVIVGPEDPLVHGIYDFFIADPEISHVPVIGPSARGAMLEGSKDFAKQFMFRHGIPTARYRAFDQNSISDGVDFLQTLDSPYVIKADGLAAGKGVLIINDLEKAIQEFKSIFEENRFGQAAKKVIIEEYLQGIEVSVFVITDGKTYKLLPEAKDYKRIGENDTGPNTGGMGSVSPVPFADRSFMDKVLEKIIKPTIRGISAEGINYLGFIFFGLMNVNGNPYVIEYNCRLGDPETESLIPRLMNDLVQLCKSAAKGNLESEIIQTDPRSTATVMLVSQGYPEAYEKHKIITGTENITDSLVFHAGTTLSGSSGEVITNGGRVMAITSYGTSLKEALEKSYANAETITFDGKYYRRDLGFDLCL
jgi:phosphoribosylamine--glycine ligase